jgi:glutamyl-tRNA reductase
VELVTKRIVNKILHQPITNLKRGAENGRRNSETLFRIQTLRDIFGISNRKPDGGDE